MMQKEKLLKRSVLIAAAATSLTIVPTVAKAEAGDFADAGLGTVSADASNGVLKVQVTAGATEALVGTGKVKIKKGEKTGTITVSNWDVYDTGTASDDNRTEIQVDLSKLKNTVDNYLVLQSNKSTDNNVAIVKIPVKAKYTKVKYDAENGLQAGYGASSGAAALTSLDKTAEGSAVPKEQELEYRTVYSNWKPMDGDTKPNLELYQENGTQLYVRLEAGSVSGALQKGEEKLSYDDKDPIPVYEAPNLPGKEVKVSIPAKAKGASISADFTKGTVKIPKKSEYRIVEGDKVTAKNKDATVGADGCKYEYRPATDGKAQEVNSLFGETSGTTSRTAVLEVRKAATAKKAASKWSRLEIQTQEDMKNYVTVTDTTPVESVKTTKEQKKAAGEEYTGNGGIKASTVFEDKEKQTPALKFDYAKSKKTSPGAVYDSVSITNTSTNEYEIYIGSETPNATTKATIKVSAKKSATTESKPITKKLDKFDLTKVWVRKAGNKQKKHWATTWTELGFIDYPLEKTQAADKKDDNKDNTKS